MGLRGLKETLENGDQRWKEGWEHESWGSHSRSSRGRSEKGTHDADRPREDDDVELATGRKRSGLFVLHLWGRAADEAQHEARVAVEAAGAAAVGETESMGPLRRTLAAGRDSMVAQRRRPRRTVSSPPIEGGREAWAAVRAGAYDQKAAMGDL